MPVRLAAFRGRIALGRKLAVSGVLGLTVALAACSSSSPPTSSTASGSASASASGVPTSTAASGLPQPEVANQAIISGLKEDPALAALLPAKYQGATLTVATDAEYAPDEFLTANNQIVGWDPNLAEAIAKVLGIKIKFDNIQFDSIIPGLQAGRFNFSISSMGAYPYRVKLVDFVTVFTAGITFMERSNETGVPITGLSSLCGLTVAAQSGTIEAITAQGEEKSCPSGKPLNLLTFPQQPNVNLALASGRAQVAFADSPIVAYQVEVGNGEFKQVGPILTQGLEGMAIPKTEGIAKALNAAANYLIAQGVWKKLLDNWGQDKGMITHSTLVTSPSQVNAAANLVSS